MIVRVCAVSTKDFCDIRTQRSLAWKNNKQRYGCGARCGRPRRPECTLLVHDAERRASAAHCPVASTAIGGVLSWCESRIFFAGACIMSGSYELSGRVPVNETGTVSRMLGVSATGDARDDADADVDTSGGDAPPLVALFDRAFAAGSLT